MISERVIHLLPPRVRSQVEEYADALSTLFEVRDPRVLTSIGPSAIRGTLLKRGKQGVPTTMPASHRAYFDWSYPHDFPEMKELYDRAKRGQWDGDDLPWHTNVDPYDPNVALVPEDFFAYDVLEEEIGVKFTQRERDELQHAMVSWMLSQFLHGEQ
ncbi:MAG: hypothetical protein KC619_04640, partial [Myxococcales bacterium]|nr:hypothetical protein [Myxococcales bacterium]